MKFLLDLPPAVAAAIVSAMVALVTTLLATPLQVLVKRHILGFRLRSEYDYEQRRKLRELIGLYVGRMLEAAENLNHRFWNLYTNEARGWLDAGGHYEDLDKLYYFKTTAYRFLAVCALLRRFESEAIFIDSRIAEKDDLYFVKYLKALRWALTDVALFEGLEYSTFDQTDHIFSDNLRMICDACWTEGKFCSIEEFPTLVRKKPQTEAVLKFLDGINANDPRLRWDRVVVFHLLLMGFLNTFGYDMQVSTDEQFRQVAAKVRNPKILRNLSEWLPKLGLDEQSEAIRIIHATCEVATQLTQDAN